MVVDGLVAMLNRPIDVFLHRGHVFVQKRRALELVIQVVGADVWPLPAQDFGAEVERIEAYRHVIVASPSRYPLWMSSQYEFGRVCSWQ